MDAVKTTPILAELMEYAVNLKGSGSVFSAERFFLASIEKTRSCGEECGSAELLAVKKLIEDTCRDVDAAKMLLADYISRSSAPLMIEDFYMKRKLRQAEALCTDGGREAVDSVTLLMLIIYEPDEIIQAVLVPNYVKKNRLLIDFSIFKFLPGSLNSKEEAYEGVNEALGRMRAEYSEDEHGEILSREVWEVSSGNMDYNKSDAVKSKMTELISDVKRIRDKLQKKIYGQDNAINVFLTGYFRASMMAALEEERKKPLATFLFAGPPGVGKTFLAEQAADALDLPFERFDMSEYCDKEAAIEFCGSDGVYKNSKQGNFTSYISKNPKCVILLDEIEKAHISIIHLFLQVLDAGRIRDSKTDNEISLKDVILIFTTNAGKQLYRDSDDKDLSVIPRKVIIDALEKDVNSQTGEPYFPAAICSRFASGNVVMFNHVGVHDLLRIASEEFSHQGGILESGMGIKVETDPLVYTSLLFSEGIKADARTTKSRAAAFFNDELYELFRLISTEKVKTAISDVERIKFEVDLNGMPKGVKNLFSPEEKKSVILLSDKNTRDACLVQNPNCNLIGITSSQKAISTIRAKEVDLIILDVKYGASSESDGRLNIEDIETPARQLLKILQEQRSAIPIYLLQREEDILDEEEKISYARQGVMGIFNLSANEGEPFAAQLKRVLSVLHRQKGLIKLARENKLVSFDTSQSVSEDGKEAVIQLYDFKTILAVESEDSDRVLSREYMPNVSFKDVIGAEGAKKELEEFVKYLKNPKQYMGTGLKAPKGVILYGPSGTGKTMLAKAMAREAGVTIIATEGNKFIKKYLGEGAEKVHELFGIARKYAPSILFVDEIDAIAKERRGGDAAAASIEATLTAFLTEMDGFVNDPSKPVFVLAATNFEVEPGKEKSLDPALMRRFDRRVYIDLPNKDNRIKFLRKKIRENRALDISPSKVRDISVRATGMSLAALESVVDLSLRSAIREGIKKVNDAVFEEAFETFTEGEIKKWDDSRLERVAVHEAGHTVLCWLSGKTPSYLTIVARGNQGGYMQSAENEGEAIYTKEELFAGIRTSLGGRAAELVYYGPEGGISTGAGGDLVSATNTARQIVCAYGMDEDFGLAVDGESAQTGRMPPEVRSAVNRILKEQMDIAVEMITKNKDKIDTLVDALMSKNHLNGEEIEEMLNKSQA